MPHTLQFGFEYRLAHVAFVNKRVQMSVSALVRLDYQKVTDLCASVLAESLERQGKTPGLKTCDFFELLLWAEQFKRTAPGFLVPDGGECFVVKATLRPECQSQEPGATRATDFELRAFAPERRLLPLTRWAASARNVVLDERWGRGRFSV